MDGAVRAKPAVGDLHLPGYDILEPIGKGGMGQVHKARQRTLDRIVAVKVIRAELLDNPDVVRRFQREARAAARLAHPNIVTIFDAAEADGIHFLVMEYVDGDNLGALVSSVGPLPVRQVCDWVRQAALGLQHLHERGLVHRDIKPHNLLVSSDRKIVKILDLGLARLETDPRRRTRLTQLGMVLGTPAYLAPEQGLDPIRADVRSDIYSLGCTMYHLLTGQTPFQAASVEEFARQHQSAEPEAIAKLRPEAPADLAALVTRMLAKRPTDRYQCATAVAVALAAFCQAPAAKTVIQMQPAVTPQASAVETVSYHAGPASKTNPSRRRPAPTGRSRALGIVFLVFGILTLVLLAVLGQRIWSSSSKKKPGPETPLAKNHNESEFPARHAAEGPKNAPPNDDKADKAKQGQNIPMKEPEEPKNPFVKEPKINRAGNVFAAICQDGVNPMINMTGHIVDGKAVPNQIIFHARGNPPIIARSLDEIPAEYGDLMKYLLHKIEEAR